MHTSSFDKYCQITLNEGCNNLLSHQKCLTVPIFPYPHQYCGFSYPVILVNSRDKTQFFSAVLFCIYHIIRKVEHLLYMLNSGHICSCLYYGIISLAHFY